MGCRGRLARSDWRAASQVFSATRDCGPSRARRSAIPLAADGGQPAVEVDVVDVQAGQFADAHAGRVERFQDRAVPEPQRRVGRWCCQQPREVFLTQEMRQFLVLARAAQRVGGIGGQHALPAQEATPGTDGRQPPGHGALGVALFAQPGDIRAQQPGGQARGRHLAAGHLAAEEAEGLREVLAVRFHRVRRGISLQRQVAEELGQDVFHDCPHMREPTVGVGSEALAACSRARSVSTAASNQLKLDSGSAARSRKASIKVCRLLSSYTNT